jgi:hypothetical protein
MRPTTALSLALAAGGLLSTPAVACKGKSILYRDDFRKVAPGWDSQEWFSIGGGRAMMRPDVGKALTVMLHGATFDEADICADVVMARPANPAKPFAGVVFWADNYSNLYGLFVNLAGNAAIVRVQDRKWSLLVPWRRLEGMQTRPGGVNTLRVTLKGNSATAYVNDQTFVSFTGVRPQDGGMIGFHGESEQSQADTWMFANLKITEP